MVSEVQQKINMLIQQNALKAKKEKEEKEEKERL
jgi:hypothetical protein